MRKLVAILASFAVVAGVFGVVSAKPAEAATAAQCKQTLVDSAGNRGIKISPDGKTASVTIIVENIDKCVNKYASLSSWQVPGKDRPIVHPFNNQKFYAHTAKKLVNGRQTMQVAVPQCYYQIDLFSTRQLKPARPAPGTPNSNFFGPNDILANFKLGGNKSCEKPDLKPTCSISASKTNVKPGEKVTITWSSQNAVKGVISGGIGQVTPSGSKEVTINNSITFVGIFTSKTGKKVTCETTVTVNGVPPTTTTPPAVAAATTPESGKLASTGPGATVAAISGISSVLAGLGHYVVRKRFLV